MPDGAETQDEKQSLDQFLREMRGAGGNTNENIEFVDNGNDRVVFRVANQDQSRSATVTPSV